ncbi:MAG: hypothetical protein H0X51_02715 [Parachlamydiaceae bacterium]|nr:hypothetical protein [Parachlamydiaceae bacterium]
MDLKSDSRRPPMQASKWLLSPILIDPQEMQALFDSMGPFSIYQTSNICKRGEGLISATTFLQHYREYIVALQEGRLLDESEYRSYFSTVFTADPDLLYVVPVGEDRQLIRVAKPVIQLQSHHLNYSFADGKFRSMTFGSSSITWGVQFSYPQLFQDAATQQPESVVDSPSFPNTALFHRLQRWVRHNTLPTPFLVGDTQINVPMRLGKNCFAWINQHPQLREQGIRVRIKENSHEH